MTNFSGFNVIEASIFVLNTSEYATVSDFFHIRCENSLTVPRLLARTLRFGTSLVMETLRSQDVQSTRALVQQYLQNAESLGSGAEERSHLAQLCTECILLFRIILKTMAANNDSSLKQWKMLGVSLRRSYGRLKIWSEEHGATDGSLDATLAASRDLQRDTVKYLVSISQTLTESKSIHLLEAQASY